MHEILLWFYAVLLVMYVSMQLFLNRSMGRPFVVAIFFVLLAAGLYFGSFTIVNVFILLLRDLDEETEPWFQVFAAGGSVFSFIAFALAGAFRQFGGIQRPSRGSHWLTLALAAALLTRFVLGAIYKDLDWI